MSSVQAIAAVTETLRNLLAPYVASAVSGATVSAASPDPPSGALANPGVNIFLYQIAPNAALRNRDLPTRTRDGTLLSQPQAAIDLHYLLTFYGDYTALEPERILGAVALALHANPVLPRSLILSTENSLSFLSGTNLDAQSEVIRFTPLVFTLEEMSKLWSFLLKTDYVLSTAYVASVVLIDANEPLPPPPLPVQTYRLNARPLSLPAITQVVASPNPGAPITAGSDIALIGTNLTAPPGGATQILIGGIAQTPASIAPTRITLALPAGLSAGSQTAQVMQPLMLGIPPVLHPGTGGASGIATFVLNPIIAPGSLPGSYALSVNPSFGSPPEPALVVSVIPTVRAGQRVLLQLLPQTSPPAAAGRLFDGGTLTADSDTVTIPVPGLATGTYAVRVLVDGAESALVLGPGRAPIAPLVTV